MSRIKIDSISEEMISSSKVVRGPKSTQTLVAVTDGIYVSDQQINKNENETGSEAIREKNALDALEKVKIQLYNGIEEASEKSVQTRVNGLQKIVNILIHNYIPEIVNDQQLTIAELVEKSLKRVKVLDTIAASKTASLLVVQLGNNFDRFEIINDLIVKIVTDTSNDLSVRAECCSILGAINFLRDVNIDELEAAMTVFETIINIGNKATVSEDESVLRSAAIFAWGLLFTKVSSKYLNSSALLPLTNTMIKLLESPHLNIRLAAGELLCLLLEHGRSTGDGILIETIEEHVDITKFLSHDTQKFRHKNDLKIQRATFRDVSRYIEENIQPDIKMVFGVELIEIDSWTLHYQYVALCSVIGPGLATHMIQNEFIRDTLNVNDIRKPLYKKSFKHDMQNESERIRTLERRDDRKYKLDGLVGVGDE